MPEAPRKKKLTWEEKLQALSEMGINWKIESFGYGLNAHHKVEIVSFTNYRDQVNSMSHGEYDPLILASRKIGQKNEFLSPMNIKTIVLWLIKQLEGDISGVGQFR